MKIIVFCVRVGIEMFSHLGRSCFERISPQFVVMWPSSTPGRRDAPRQVNRHCLAGLMTATPPDH